MVSEVIRAEGGAVRDADGEVCKDGEGAVVYRGAEREVVRDFVDC